MATYQQAPEKVTNLVAAVMKRNHPDLHKAEVTVGVLMAYGPRRESDGQLAGPAIKVNGYPALGRIKINSLQHRVEGMPDATMTLDGDEWKDMDEDRKIAIIDHELHHLQVKVLRRDADTDQPIVESDDVGRPKLKIRLHDLVVGGFAEIVRRHGDAAVEAEQVKLTVMLLDKVGHQLFSFMRGEVGTQELAGSKI